MRTEWIIGFAAGSWLLFVGCGKQDRENASAATGQGSASQTTGVSVTSAATSSPPTLAAPPKYIANNAENLPRENVAGQTDTFLTEQLRIYVRQTGRLPRTFAEFAAARLDSIPRPPPGTKWVIDAGHTEVRAGPAQ